MRHRSGSGRPLSRRCRRAANPGSGGHPAPCAFEAQEHAPAAVPLPRRPWPRTVALAPALAGLAPPLWPADDFWIGSLPLARENGAGVAQPMRPAHRRGVTGPACNCAATSEPRGRQGGGMPAFPRSFWLARGAPSLRVPAVICPRTRDRPSRSVIATTRRQPAPARSYSCRLRLTPISAQDESPSLATRSGGAATL